MSTQIIDVSSADFIAYKDQIKTFLKSQDQFKDYDFTGSNMSVLLDVLAYNTFQNVFYDNMSINEMFLDSAVLRNSILSHAKSLNYLPRSKTSAVAKISFAINVTSFIPFIVIPAKTRFVSQSGGTSYSFFTQEAITVLRNNGVYETCCIDVFEGSYVTEKNYSNGKADQKFVISSSDVDTRSIRVYVTDTLGNREEYVQSSTIQGVGLLDNVFYVQCTDGKYEIVFGQNVFGKMPSIDSIVEIDYRRSSGPAANGISSFSFSGAIGGFSVSAITTVSAASGGANEESNASIKFNAPRAIQIQDRAITETDYRILLKSKFPEITDVAVVGGEKLDPPQYGKVALFIDTVNASGMSENTMYKVYDYIKNKVPLGIEPIFMSPEFMYYVIDTKITYDTSKYTLSFGAVRNSVRNAILAYRDANLDRFGADFRYSKLISDIDEIDRFAVISNQTIVRPYIEKIPSIGGIRNTYTINFGNELVPITDYSYRAMGANSIYLSGSSDVSLDSKRSDRTPTVYSSDYVYNGKNVYFRDNGFGVIQVVQNKGKKDIIVVKNIGKVDYKRGIVSLSNLVMDSYSGSAFRIYVTPKNQDILTPSGALPSIKQEDIIVSVISTEQDKGRTL